MVLSADSLVSGTPASGDASSALRERDKVQTLLKAAQEGDLQTLKEQARQNFHGQMIDKIRDGRGRNALHFASQAGHAQVCEALISELGADVNGRSEDGDTPLDLASAAGQLNVCQLLAQLGASTHTSGTEQPQPVHRAAASGHLQVLKWLLDQGSPTDATSSAGTPLLWAAGSGQVSALRTLLQAKANPNAVGADGVTAILMASAAGSSVAVKELIKAGANVNVKAAGGVTPLHAAAECGSLDTVAALLQAGADADARDDSSHTALDAAAGEGDRAIIDLLLSKTTAYIENWTVDGILAHARSAGQGSGAASAAGSEAVPIPPPIDPDEEAAAHHKRLGDEAFVNKDYDSAVTSYSKSLDHSTSSHLPWANRSAAHLQLGQAELALKDAQMARTICPSFAKAWYREGTAAGQLDQWELAANAFYSGYHHEPNNKVLAEAFQDAVWKGRDQHQRLQKDGFG